MGPKYVKPSSSKSVAGTSMPLACSSSLRASSYMGGTTDSICRATSRAFTSGRADRMRAR